MTFVPPDPVVVWTLSGCCFRNRIQKKNTNDLSKPQCKCLWLQISCSWSLSTSLDITRVLIPSLYLTPLEPVSVWTHSAAGYFIAMKIYWNSILAEHPMQALDLPQECGTKYHLSTFSVSKVRAAQDTERISRSNQNASKRHLCQDTKNRSRTTLWHTNQDEHRRLNTIESWTQRE